MARGKIWHFVRPRNADKVIRFENETGETFEAMYKAEHWLYENGYIYGSTDGGRYVPAMKGSKYTLPQKLFNFDLKDYMQVTAVMYSHDYRDGWVEVWLIEPMYILDLVVMHKWYDMILSGEKPEEYREGKPYWNKILTGYKTDVPLFSFRYGYREPNVRGYTHVRFHRGYTNTTIIHRIDGITFGMGNPDWGAPKDKKVYIIKLGERY